MISMKYGAIIINGDYPLGSAALRKRMMHEGLLLFGIETELLHYFPALSVEDQLNSEPYVRFFQKPSKNGSSTESKMSRSVFSIISRIVGILGVIQYLRSRKVQFLLISGGLIEGVLLTAYCKTNNVKYFIEKADENRRKFLQKKKIKDHLAILYEDLFDKVVIKKCDRLFVVSKYLEEKYRSMHKGLVPSRSTPSFVDLEANQLSRELPLAGFISPKQESFIRNKKINVVFCGSYIFRNGVDFFLECAARIIHNDQMDFQIVLVLFKGHMRLLNQKIHELDLEKNIIIIENVLSQKIPAIYNHADILVLPEMGIEVAHAGFPGKTAEYLASGKAIISTEFSNITDYLKHEHNVLMSPIGDKKSYIANLKRLIVDEDLRLRLGKNARRTARDFFSLDYGIKYLVDSINDEYL